MSLLHISSLSSRSQIHASYTWKTQLTHVDRDEDYEVENILNPAEKIANQNFLIICEMFLRSRNNIKKQAKYATFHSDAARIESIKAKHFLEEERM